jgi:hypothetical protein
MISEPEARASLYHSLTAQTFDRSQFDLYLNTYLRQRSGVSLAAREDQLSVSHALADAATNPELAAFAALMAADYDRAKEIVEGMAAPDRAVLEFWATELSQLVSHVQITEERF